MKRTFSHLSYEQRLLLRQMLDSGSSKAVIATQLGCHIATVYREIERGSRDGAYQPEFAETAYQRQLRQSARKPLLSIHPDLAKRIADYVLNDHLSIAQILERLKDEKQPAVISSTATLYRAIDQQLIPGVTRETLCSNTTTVFNGQIYLAKWVKERLNIQDGDLLQFEVEEDRLILTKTKSQ